MACCHWSCLYRLGVKLLRTFGGSKSGLVALIVFVRPKVTAISWRVASVLFGTAFELWIAPRCNEILVRFEAAFWMSVAAQLHHPGGWLEEFDWGF